MRLKQSIKQGLTLVELAVVIGIIAVLVSLTLVGVVSIRESARRIECSNKIRQLSLSLTDIISRSGKIPSFRAVEVNDELTGRTLVGNVLVLLAAELGYPYQSQYAHITVGDLINGEVFPPPILVCPSNETYMSSYRVNLGTDVWLGEGETINNQLFSHLPKHANRVSSVVDGLTHTCAFAERIGVDYELLKPWAIASASTPHFTDDLLAECESSFVSGSVIHRLEFTRSVGWPQPHFAAFGYNHVFPPNAPEVDCAIYQFSDANFRATSRIVPRSNHFRSVNVAFLDSSVRLIPNSIDQTVWQALGTHNGSEIGNLEQ